MILCVSIPVYSYNATVLCCEPYHLSVIFICYVSMIYYIFSFSCMLPFVSIEDRMLLFFNLITYKLKENI